MVGVKGGKGLSGKQKQKSTDNKTRKCVDGIHNNNSWVKVNGLNGAGDKTQHLRGLGFGAVGEDEVGDEVAVLSFVGFVDDDFGAGGGEGLVVLGKKLWMLGKKL